MTFNLVFVSKRFAAAALAVAVLLSGCVSQTRTQSDADYGPDRPIDVSHVTDAEPKIEVRTRAGNPESYVLFGKRYHVLKDHRGYSKEGIASWYGYKFHGRKTSNGETYDMFKMTAAHKTLPIPSYVKVTNLDNGRAITVRINDRGPFHEGRIIDLSYAGAAKLGIDQTGTGRVRVDAIDVNAATIEGKPVPAVKMPANLFLQMGAFSKRASADEYSRRLTGLLDYSVKVSADADGLYKVRIGPIADAMALEQLQKRLQALNINGSFLVHE